MPNLIESDDCSSPKIILDSKMETLVFLLILFSKIATKDAMKALVPPIIEASVSPVKTGVSSFGPTG